MASKGSLPAGGRDKLSQLERDVLRICNASENGLTDAEVRSQLPDTVTPHNRLEAYNNLLSRGRIQVVERPVGADGRRVVVYKWVSAEDAQRLAGLNAAERMVYELIAKSKENGQTKRDLRVKTNIHNNSEFKAIIERLTFRKLIKEIKSIKSSNKRVYIVAELEASQSHTGGPWYGDDQEFDQEFIHAMYEFVLAFISERDAVTVEEVAERISISGLSNETLTEDDVSKLMMTMLQDNQIEICKGDEIRHQYFRKTRPLPSVRMHMAQPCFKCPVKRHCTPGGVISPSNCVYMDDWIRSCYDW